MNFAHPGNHTIKKIVHTGKSLSEALLFAEHGKNMFELGIFMYWTCNSMKNLSSYCGLVDAKIRASDKDLPAQLSVKYIKDS